MLCARENVVHFVGGRRIRGFCARRWEVVAVSCHTARTVRCNPGPELDWDRRGIHRMALAHRLLGMDPAELTLFACRGDDADEQKQMERDVTRVYRQRMLTLHPDKVPADRRVDADLASRLASNCRTWLVRWLAGV